MTEETEVFHGSSNVFADLGLPDAEELLRDFIGTLLDTCVNALDNTLSLIHI